MGKPQLYEVTSASGGHAPAPMQLVDDGRAWCPTCGEVVNVSGYEVYRSSDEDTIELYALLGGAP